MIKKLGRHQRMYYLYTKFIKTLEICKQFFEYLVNEAGNYEWATPRANRSLLNIIHGTFIHGTHGTEHGITRKADAEFLGTTKNTKGTKKAHARKFSKHETRAAP